MRFVFLAVASASAALAALLLVGLSPDQRRALAGSIARGADAAPGVRGRRLTPGQRLDMMIEEALGRDGRRLLSVAHTIGRNFDTAISSSNIGVKAGKQCASDFGAYKRNRLASQSFQAGKTNSGSSFSHTYAGKAMSGRSAHMMRQLTEANPDNQILTKMLDFVEGDKFSGPIADNMHYSGRMLTQVDPGAHARVQQADSDMGAMLSRMDEECGGGGTGDACKTPEEYAHEAVHHVGDGLHALLDAVSALGDLAIDNLEDQAIELVDVAIANVANFFGR